MVRNSFISRAKLSAMLLVAMAATAPLQAKSDGPLTRSDEDVLEEARKTPRLFVLTDIGGDPDDRMSLVRLMTYSNQINIEGMVATPNGKGIFPEQIKEIVAAYGQVRDNLLLHESGFPEPQAVAQTISVGPGIKGMAAVGDGKDTAGSNALISAVDRSEAPLWISVWGGPNVLAQALYRVRNERSPKELAAFIRKLRVYAISDQDDSGPWIRKNFPNLFYIVSPGSTFHFSTWIGIGGDYFHGRFAGGDWSLVTNRWLDHNIRNKGPLGAVYPRWEFMMEGDTPSFLNLLDNGLSVPERPDWGGWGGRYELYTPRTRKWFFEPETRAIWSDAEDEVFGHDGHWHTSNYATIWRWREAYQNDFAARMDWTIKKYSDANHPPVPVLASPTYIQARAGERVELSAAGTSDPDGDPVSYRWFVYEEAGTRSMSSSDSGLKHAIYGFDQQNASLVVKSDRVVKPGTGTMHIILAVTDHGSPHLTRYKRTIIDVVS